MRPSRFADHETNSHRCSSKENDQEWPEPAGRFEADGFAKAPGHVTLGLNQSARAVCVPASARQQARYALHASVHAGLPQQSVAARLPKAERAQNCDRNQRLTACVLGPWSERVCGRHPPRGLTIIRYDRTMDPERTSRSVGSGENAARVRLATRADIPRLSQVIERSVRELQRHDYTELQIEGALETIFGVDTTLTGAPQQNGHSKSEYSIRDTKRRVSPQKRGITQRFLCTCVA